MPKILLDIDFKRAVNELIGDYFYLFSHLYGIKNSMPTNIEMLNVMREQLNYLFGRKVYLGVTQKAEFEKVFTREYNLIVNGR